MAADVKIGAKREKGHGASEDAGAAHDDVAPAGNDRSDYHDEQAYSQITVPFFGGTREVLRGRHRPLR